MLFQLFVFCILVKLVYTKICVEIEKSIGMVSGEFILAYPPGIPVLCPGEIITEEIVEYIKYIKEEGLYIQGTEDITVKNIKIIK